MWTGCISPGQGEFSNYCIRSYETLNSVDGGELRDNVSRKSIWAQRVIINYLVKKKKDRDLKESGNFLRNTATALLVRDGACKISSATTGCVVDALGVRASFTCNVQRVMDFHYEDRRIGPGLVLWPPRSPDLTTPHFCVTI